MYRCDDNIGGCLSVSASRIGSGLRVTACRAGAQVSVSASRIGSGLRVTACRAGAQVSVSATLANDTLQASAWADKPIQVDARSLTPPLKVTASRVCDVGEIAPVEGYFITADGFIFATAEGYLFRPADL